MVSSQTVPTAWNLRFSALGMLRRQPDRLGCTEALSGARAAYCSANLSLRRRTMRSLSGLFRLQMAEGARQKRSARETVVINLRDEINVCRGCPCVRTADNTTVSRGMVASATVGLSRRHARRANRETSPEVLTSGIYQAAYHTSGPVQCVPSGQP